MTGTDYLFTPQQTRWQKQTRKQAWPLNSGWPISSLVTHLSQLGLKGFATTQNSATIWDAGVQTQVPLGSISIQIIRGQLCGSLFSYSRVPKHLVCKSRPSKHDLNTRGQGMYPPHLCIRAQQPSLLNYTYCEHSLVSSGMISRKLLTREGTEHNQSQSQGKSPTVNENKV